MKIFSFAEYGNKKASALSEGTKQKLNLVLSLLHNPDLMIMYEPYSSKSPCSFITFAVSEALRSVRSRRTVE